MWPWIKRWRDWAMHDLWPMHRIGPQPQALHYSYEKAGLTLHDQPIAWNAEAVLVEIRLRLQGGARQKGDFQLRLPGPVAVPAEQLRKDGDNCHRLTFRLPPLPHSVTAEVLWRNCHLGQMTLPVLTQEEFIDSLRLQMPTLFVRLNEQSVACQTFVSTQCKGLIASAVLLSPFSLVPLLDLGLGVEFRSERGGTVHRAPAQLCSSQLAGKQALITVVPRRFPKRIGAWTATWMLGEMPLATQRIRAISQRTFQRSLRIADTRFVHQSRSSVTVRRQMPDLEKGDRVGPCFLVASREPGMAGLCQLQVRAQVPGAVQPPLLLEQELLVTDGPTVLAPGTLDAADLGQVTGFELRLKGGSLGVLPLSPAPSAAFNAEGGFKAPDHFLWSAAADEELNDRLGKLLNEPSKGQ